MQKTDTTLINVRIWYLVSWVYVITLGSMIFGYTTVYFNSLTVMIYKQYQYHNANYIENRDTFNSVVTTMIILGTMIGSFTISPFLSFGRRNCMLAVNLIIIIGAAINMIFNFWALLLGRLLIGWGCGAFSVIAPIMINEISPISISGILGSAVQINFTFGFLLAYAFGFAVPYQTRSNGTENHEIYTSEIWKLLFIFPGIVALIQILLLLLVFKDDSPNYYQQNEEFDRYVSTLSSIYVDNESIIQLYKSNNESILEVADTSSIGIFETRYLYTLFIGIMIFTIPKTTGVNATFFYSNEIFTMNYTGYKAEKEARIGTLMIGVVMFLTSFFSPLLLSRFGRRTILLIGHTGMLIFLTALGVSAIYDLNLWIKIFTVCYLFFFNPSIGTISWIIGAEVLNSKGMAFSTSITWPLTIMFSLYTNQGFKLLTAEGVYFLFAVFQIFSILFCYFMLKETKGLPKEQCQRLYMKQNVNSSF